MKRKYEVLDMELVYICVDVITFSVEGDDNVGGLPGSTETGGWTPGA